MPQSGKTKLLRLHRNWVVSSTLRTKRVQFCMQSVI